MKHTKGVYEKEIEVSGLYRIHPSYSHAGITSGTVEVLAITDAYDNDALRKGVENHLNKIVTDLHDKEHLDTAKFLNESLWVTYQYVSRISNDGTDEDTYILYMDIETFAMHTTVM